MGKSFRRSDRTADEMDLFEGRFEARVNRLGSDHPETKHQAKVLAALRKRADRDRWADR